MLRRFKVSILFILSFLLILPVMVLAQEKCVAKRAGKAVPVPIK